MVDRVSPAVVSVVSRGSAPHPRVPGHEVPEKDIPRRGSGAGFIMDKRGYVLTNNHVVEGASEVRVVLSDKREFEAKVVGGDSKSDLALLKIEARGELPVAKLGDSDEIRIGQWAIAIGNPFGLTRTVTVGVVSGVGRSGLGVATYENFIQTDAAISPGNSGGPLLNLKGEVIGVNTAIFSRGSGIGFAIPINMAGRVAQQLITRGRVVRGFLGVIIQPLTGELARKFGVQSRRGALVGDFLEGGPAEKGGIQRGDIILGFNGQEVEDVAHLQRLTAGTAPGTEVSLLVLRGGKEEKVRVTLSEMMEDKRPVQRVTERAKEEYGLTLKELTPELAREFELKADARGVLVTEVEKGSQASFDGIRKGDLIAEIEHEPMRDLQDFERAFSAVKKGEDVRVLLMRKKRTFYMILHAPK